MLTIERTFPLNLESFKTIARGIGAYAFLAEPEDEKMKMDLDEVALRERLTHVTPGAGASSTFTFPVWEFPPPSDEEYQKRAVIYFDKDDIEVDIRKLLTGSFSLEIGDGLFYCPLHIEVAHELIHVQDNAHGMNREQIRSKHFTKALSKWDNAEEFFTITADHINENRFNEELGLPKRTSHRGFTIQELYSPDLFDQLISEIWREADLRVGIPKEFRT
jgi:hypothetical protein